MYIRRFSHEGTYGGCIPLGKRTSRVAWENPLRGAALARSFATCETKTAVCFFSILSDLILKFSIYSDLSPSSVS